MSFDRRAIEQAAEGLQKTIRTLPRETARVAVAARLAEYEAQWGKPVAQQLRQLALAQWGKTHGKKR